MNTLLLDLGSHSAKAYLKDEQLRQVGTVTWRLLEERKSIKDLENEIRELIRPFRGVCKKFIAVGTEAMRRNHELRRQIRKVCQSLGITYRTLSHEDEALLIRTATPEFSNHDIINAGGGSIQILPRNSDRLSLLSFGISDLNLQFSLNDEPDLRKTEECIAWVTSRLPNDLSDFVYTGGEEKYLRHLGIPLSEGRCTMDNFEALTKYLSGLALAELESLSPHDPKWMRGAVASNCIVLACMRKSGAKSFVPSDTNIAHGLMSSALDMQ